MYIMSLFSSAKDNGLVLPSNIEARLNHTQQIASAKNMGNLWRVKSTFQSQLKKRRTCVQITTEDDSSIVEALQRLTAVMECSTERIVTSETTVLVNILFRPECLFPRKSVLFITVEDGKFLQR